MCMIYVGNYNFPRYLWLLGVGWKNVPTYKQNRWLIKNVYSKSSQL